MLLIYFKAQASNKHVKNIHTLKEAARQAFEERMKDAKSHMEEQVSFLQRRIV